MATNSLDTDLTAPATHSDNIAGSRATYLPRFRRMFRRILSAKRSVSDLGLRIHIPFTVQISTRDLKVIQAFVFCATYFFVRQGLTLIIDNILLVCSLTTGGSRCLRSPVPCVSRCIHVDTGTCMTKPHNTVFVCKVVARCDSVLTSVFMSWALVYHFHTAAP